MDDGSDGNGFLGQNAVPNSRMGGPIQLSLADGGRRPGGHRHGLGDDVPFFGGMQGGGSLEGLAEIIN